MKQHVMNQALMWFCVVVALFVVAVAAYNGSTVTAIVMAVCAVLALVAALRYRRRART